MQSVLFLITSSPHRLITHHLITTSPYHLPSQLISQQYQMLDAIVIGQKRIAIILNIYIATVDIIIAIGQGQGVLLINLPL